MTTFTVSRSSLDAGYARRFETPLVGREDELLVVRKAFERSVRDRRGYLVTVFGPAGIGAERGLLARDEVDARVAALPREWAHDYG